MRAPLVLVFVLASCVTADRYRNAHAPDAPKITVLVPGYEGSFLYAGDERVWISPLDAFSRGARSLGSCEAGRLPLTPGGPITRFTIFPYVLDFYADLIEWAQPRLTGFTAFGYDWRDDLPTTAQALCDFIGERKADVIAHSMGGLVTLLALQRCPGRIERAVFAGTPFGGAPGVFKDLSLGRTTVRNTAFLSAPAMWTFASPWQVMPVTDDFFADAQGKPMTLPLTDPGTWSRWLQACPQRLKERLRDHVRMRDALAQPIATPPRTLAVIGRGRDTTDAIRWTGDGFDFEHPLRADGDGTIVAHRAVPPFKAAWLYTPTPHVALLNDDGVRAAIAEFLK
jgi:pimeloyl-ACP methyl ester carboxylesterase